MIDEQQVPESLLLVVDALRRGVMNWSDDAAAPLRTWLQEDPRRQQWLDEELQFAAVLQRASERTVVPVDLARRLRQTVAASAAVSHRKAAGVHAVPGREHLRRDQRGRRWFKSARFQFGVGMATAVALLLTVVGAVWWGVSRQRHPVLRSLDAVIVKSGMWYDQLMADPNWEVNLQSALEEYPLIHGVPARVQRGRPYMANWGLGFVYDLTQANGVAALLFVVRPNEAYAVNQGLTAAPVYVDDRYAVGAGEQGGLVYILVVRGTDREYRMLMMNTVLAD